MAFLGKSLIAFAWTLLRTVVAVLIGYVPSLLHMVDDYRWGRVIGGLLLPTLVAMFVAGLLFANGKRRAALVVTGVVLVGYCALVVFTVLSATA